MTAEEENHFYRTNNFGGGTEWFKPGKNVEPLTKEEIAAQRNGLPSWSSSSLSASESSTPTTSNSGFTPSKSFEQDVMQISPTDSRENQSQTDNT